MTFAQTKLIAHKSHSGKTSTFNIALTNNLFDAKKSNFGAAVQVEVENARLDTLVYVNDSVSIMVTSIYCTNRRTDSTRFWNAGRDTIYNHPLFTKRKCLDSIKSILKNQYYFENDIDSTVFIGYDTILIPQEEDGNSMPVIGGLPKPPRNIKIIGLLFILGISLLIGVIGYRLNQNKQKFTKV